MFSPIFYGHKRFILPFELEHVRGDKMVEHECPTCGGKMTESEKFNRALEATLSEVPRLLRGLPEGIIEELLEEIKLCSCEDCGMILTFERVEDEEE